MVHNEDSRFWSIFSSLSNNKIAFDNQFKSLFKLMVKYDAVERGTIAEIKNNEWYKGETYSNEEYKKVMSNLLN